MRKVPRYLIKDFETTCKGNFGANFGPAYPDFGSKRTFYKDRKITVLLSPLNQKNLTRFQKMTQGLSQGPFYPILPKFRARITFNKPYI